MPEMSFAERFKKARLAKRLSQTAVAKRLKLTRNAISMWERDEANPSSEHLQKVAVILGKKVDWLATGRGSDDSIVEGLPLVGDVAAGVWIEPKETQDGEFERVPVAPDPRYPLDAQYALRIRGNSVNRIAEDGSVIACVDVIAAGIEVRDGDLVWVERRRGSLIEATVKRIRRGLSGPELWPESTEAAHQEKLPLRPAKGEAEIEVKGLVIGVYRPIPRGT